MTRIRHAVRIFGWAALNGFRETLGAVYTVQSWVLGLCLRMVAQVAFFASLGRLLGSQADVEFLLIGNAVMVAASSAFTVTVATVGERDSGTLPLLVASTTSPLIVLMGRGASFVPNGLLTSLGALLVMAPLYNVALPWARFPALLGMLVLVTVSTYMAATFLGGFVLRAPSTRRTVANVARLAMMAFCGVSVPLAVYPEGIQWVAQVLPLTHGLDAIRELFGEAEMGAVLSDAGLEALVGAGWMVASLATFRLLADAGRRDGSIVFSSV
ncbi:MAG TPA: ABC transporter permease [Acidimicrobiales bacterium]|nr:ABC transporter permease [Acidimicrobiales bacterium]